MKNTSFLILFLLISCISLAQRQEEKPAKLLPLIPLPKEVTASNDEFILTDKTKIVLTNEKFKPEVNYLNNYLKTHFDLELQVVSNMPSDGNYIMIAQPDFEAGWLENYDLTMNQNQIVFIAEGNAGLFYGIETLIQLMPLEKTKEIKILCAEIKDSPRYQWRGMHLDCSRHFFTKEEVKKYLDYLAMYKFNVFHWHLVDDQGWRIEINKYPLLTKIGSQRKETIIGKPAWDKDGKPSKDDKYDGTPYG